MKQSTAYRESLSQTLVRAGAALASGNTPEAHEYARLVRMHVSSLSAPLAEQEVAARLRLLRAAYGDRASAGNIALQLSVLAYATRQEDGHMGSSALMEEALDSRPGVRAIAEGAAERLRSTASDAAKQHLRLVQKAA